MQVAGGSLDCPASVYRSQSTLDKNSLVRGSLAEVKNAQLRDLLARLSTI